MTEYNNTPEIKTDDQLIEEFYVSQGGKPSMKEDIGFYQSDWNMLMPVVEKIEAKHRVTIDRGSVLIENEESMINCIDVGVYKRTKIQALYQAVVLYIKWYNSQKFNP